MMTKSLKRTSARRKHELRFETLKKECILLPAYARELWKAHRYKVLWGGRGATRSWTVARTLLLMAAQKKLRVLCAREMQSSLKDSVHQLLKDQIELMHLSGFIVTDREIRHANGSIFLFEGLRHNATKIKSLEGIDICWVEEAERISKDSWSILIPTIRKIGSEIWVTFNPDQEDDATYVRFILKPAKDVWQQKVSWKDNPWFSAELRAEKDYDYETDAEAADWVWGGNIRKISAAQILRGKWAIEEFTVPYHTDSLGQKVPLWNGPYQGQDFGFSSDPAAAVRLWIQDDSLYVEYESWHLHLEIDDTATQHRDDIPGFDLYTTRADSARPDTISFLRRHGLPRIRPAKKHAGSVEDGIAHLRSYRRIIVHPRCKKFADECKLYSYKVDPRSGDVLPIVIDKHNHLIDSARYALDPLIKPKRRAGLVFVDEEGISTCPQCESRLPDDGECPHCGWSKDLIDIPLDAPESEEVMADAIDADVPRIDHRHAHETETIQDRVRTLTMRKEPDSNGHGNGNGNGHGTTRFARLRSINDD